MLTLLDTGSVDWKESKPPANVADSVSAFERNSTAVNEKLGRLDAAAWDKKAAFLMDGKPVWEDTMANMVWGFLFDAIHHRGQLSSYLRPRQNSLCADCRRRLKENPLRTLDCKEEKCQRVRAQAPQIIDHLCEGCKNHFTSLLEFLDESDLPYHLDPYLVRGLDYYTKTVFEIFSDRPLTPGGTEPATVQRNALVGGGRLDGLTKLLGGKDVPVVGAAAGAERIISLMKEMEPVVPSTGAARVFLAQLGDLPKKKSLKLLEEFRKAKINIAESLGRDSLKTQLGRADKLGVEYTLILGQREVLDNTIVIRTMQTGEQKIVKLDKIIDEVKERLKR